MQSFGADPATSAKGGIAATMTVAALTSHAALMAPSQPAKIQVYTGAQDRGTAHPTMPAATLRPSTRLRSQADPPIRSEG